MTRLFSLLLVRERAEVARVHEEWKIASELQPFLSLSLSLFRAGTSGRLRVVVIFRFTLTGFVLLVLHLAGHHTRRRPPPGCPPRAIPQQERSCERSRARTSRPDVILRRKRLLVMLAAFSQRDSRRFSVLLDSRNFVLNDTCWQ